MREKGRLHAITATLGAAACLVACSTVQVGTDHDPTANFAQYKTFSFMPMTEFNSITAGRLQTAITKALQGRGLQPAAGTGDLHVSVLARFSNEKQVTATGYGAYGARWGRWAGGMGTATVQDVPVGTLVVDLVDSSANKLVWRGTASDTMKPTASGEERQEALDKAMVKLFAKYPPAPGT